MEKIIKIFRIGWKYILISRYKQIFLNKKPVYKQLALGWQIAKQLSGLKPLSLSHSKNYRLKKTDFFLCNKRETAVKQTLYQNPPASKALLGKFLNQ